MFLLRWLEVKRCIIPDWKWAREGVPGEVNHFFINIPKTLNWQFLQLDLEFFLPKEKVIFQYGAAQYEWSSSLNRCPPKFSSFFVNFIVHIMSSVTGSSGILRIPKSFFGWVVEKLIWNECIYSVERSQIEDLWKCWMFCHTTVTDVLLYRGFHEKGTHSFLCSQG